MNLEHSFTSADEIPIAVHAGNLRTQIDVLSLQTLLQPVNLLLGKLALGNVHENPHEPDAMTVIVVDRFTSRDDPTNCAVGPHHSILVTVLFSLGHGCFY